MKRKVQYPLTLPHPIRNPGSQRCSSHPRLFPVAFRGDRQSVPGWGGDSSWGRLSASPTPSSTAGRAAQPPAQWRREEPRRLRRSRRCAKSGCGESSKQKRENEGEHAEQSCVRSALRHRIAQRSTSQQGRGPEDVAATQACREPTTESGGRSSPDSGQFRDSEGAEEKRSQNADPRLRRRKDSGSRCRHVASPKAPRIVWIARCASQLDGTPPLASAPFPLGASSPDPGGTSTCKGAGQSQVPGAHHASQQLRAAGRSW